MQKSTVICAVTEEMNLSWKDGSIIEKLKELLEDCIKKTEPEYYPSVEKNTAAGKVAKTKEKELEEWLRSLEGIRELGKREEGMIYQKLV